MRIILYRITGWTIGKLTYLHNKLGKTVEKSKKCIKNVDKKKTVWYNDIKENYGHIVKNQLKDNDKLMTEGSGDMAEEMNKASQCSCTTEPYSALDVARYIINYCNDHEYSISNLKLQKILYFVQANFLVQTEQPCFKEEIEAWDFGPVIPEVYHEYKQYGSNNIPKVESYIYFDRNNLWNCERRPYNNVLNKRSEELVVEMIKVCGKYSAASLVNVTHNQDPWINSYIKGFNNVITLNSIKTYFKKDGEENNGECKE